MTKCHVMFQRKKWFMLFSQIFFSRKYKVHGSHLPGQRNRQLFAFHLHQKICVSREYSYFCWSMERCIEHQKTFYFFFQDYPSKAQNLRAIVHAYLLHESFFLWWTNCSSLDWWMTALRLMSCWRGRCRGTRIQRPEVGLLVQGNR